MKLQVEDLEALATGAVFLATGGGGDSYIPYLMARQALLEYGPVDLLAVDELADDAYIVAIGGVGAPTASLELLPSISDAGKLLSAFEEHVGRTVDAVVSFEIGGGNSLVPMLAAVDRGLPVVDGDGMGRALPEAQMMTYPICGVAPTPAVALDYEGNVVTFETASIMSYERQVRSIALSSGGMIVTAEHPMSGAQLKSAVVRDTVSFSIELGRALTKFRGTADEVSETLARLFAESIYGELRLLYIGKVINHENRISGGFDIGSVTIQSFNDRKPPLTISIKNEYLLARINDDVVASVPDLITLLDYETSLPINAERLRFGQRVAVYGVGCPAHYRTARALSVVAPRCFGFDCDYVPLERIPHTMA